MSIYPRILQQTIQAVGEAGDVLRRELHRLEGPRGHGDHAEVDELVEQLLRSRLLLIHACNFCGEETGSVVGPDSTHLWLVDPNDGTSDFLKGWRGSAVSVALLREGVPVLGVVYAFAYPDGAGDIVAWAKGCPLSRNGVEIKTDLPNRSLPLLVYVSRSADNNSVANTECVKPWRYVALPSIAYRLARVAAGDGVAAVCLNRPNGWDVAAGHALLRGDGAVLVDGAGDEVRYSPDGTCTVTDCFGGTPDVVRELCRRDWRPVFARPPRPGPPFALVGPVR